MKSFLNVIKYDYLQRTRSYGFLITLCISLAIAYSFVPEPNANYSTMRIGSYIGYYNSAWFGYVTAIMTSIFLSLVGFYLVNSGLKTDAVTRVGQIMAATSMKNKTYLLSKTCSNFLVLLTIAGLVFIMSIALFFLYHEHGFSFEMVQFVKPYLLITLPVLFFISALAVLSEVIFGRFSIIPNVGFFFIFCSLMAYGSTKTNTNFNLDVFGTKIAIHQMEESVETLHDSNEKKDLTIGYVIGSTVSKRFDFKGVNFPVAFILSRFLWILASILVILGVAPYFHRFDFRKPFSLKEKKSEDLQTKNTGQISLSSLPLPQVNFGVMVLFKTEFLLLIRQGKKWMWLLNGLGMILLTFLPIKIAHQLVLPILWFLQVHRLSSLVVKEFINEVYYFSFSSFRPLARLLTSQVLAAGFLLILLASPLIIRYAIFENFIMVVPIILGAFVIVLLAVVFGMLSKGKKLFEVLFFMITYMNINGIPIVDYFGGFHEELSYVLKLSFIVLGLCLSCISIRNYQLRHSS